VFDQQPEVTRRALSNKRAVSFILKYCQQAFWERTNMLTMPPSTGTFVNSPHARFSDLLYRYGLKVKKT
jgi:hypothetical protein